MNVEAENEHFELSDVLISWIESHKSSAISNETVDEDDIQPSGATSKVLDVLRRASPSSSSLHHLSAPGLAWNLVKIFSEKQSLTIPRDELSAIEHISSLKKTLPSQVTSYVGTEWLRTLVVSDRDRFRIDQDAGSNVRMRGNDEWAPPRPQIIFNIHEESNFRKSMQRQNYLCAGCGTKIDHELARRLVLYCYYLGKYFCKCCFSHKAIHLPSYIIQKWDFHKYPVSHFALQLLDRISNDPLFNINDINPSLYRKVKKLRHLVDIRMQLYYLKIYISTCTQTEKLSSEYTTFTHQHLLQDDVHLYSLNNLIEIQHGKLYEYLNDLASRSISHIAQCDRCRAKGHYCQLCGPSSLMSSMKSTNNGSHQPYIEPSCSSTKTNPQKLRHSMSNGNNISVTGGKNSDVLVARTSNHSRSSSGNYSNFTQSTNLSNSGQTNNPSISTSAGNHELIFPFEIGRVAQCGHCGCCFHIQCFIDAGQNCPKCERMQRRKAETNKPQVATLPDQ